MQHMRFDQPGARTARRVAQEDALPERPRTILLLQGPPSGLWSEIGRAFDRLGFRVIQVNFGLGDRLFWRGPATRVDYRGSLRGWEAFLERLIEREGIGDVLYYGDRLPYHLAPQRIAARRPGLRAWTVEHGYLRPDWLTLEPMAMARRSRFPRDPDAIRHLAEGESPVDLTERYGHPFAVEAAGEVAWNLAQVFGRFAYPRYVSDKALWPAVEYLAWLRRLLAPGGTARDARRSERALADRRPFVLVGLQLDTDYQIRASSSYRSQRAMLAEAIASFARHARPDLRLVVKLHPLDPGVINWWRVVRRLAVRHGVEARVSVVRGGNLAAMIMAARAFLTANSTSGLKALALGCPVKTLGDAVYDMPGMTHQGTLDSFWNEPEGPDGALVDAWSRAAAAHIQLRGSIYNPRGMRDGAEEIARRVQAHERYWRLWRSAPDA